ncbi:secretion protein HlyD [Sphingopyxis terrae subsp. terrae NBRC 15098]|uniref:Secretion protein HlyD n=1 Tax=Sphingopyxis terrae subsp. terrae NBRC 15098 TaxID=1219058 RepID=A0A142VXR6_9SPHN|nr:HlyD family secretion protein [Sphingopyxis terrae]AMU94618.1 secretion protein HlyD [Sphingopyxis terrae subsp. terrae NBRC 15098]
MDQLSPSRPAAAPTAPTAPTGEEVSVPKAKPKADPVPPAPEAETDEARKPGWRTRLLMFGVPLALLVGGGWYWLTSGGAVSTDNAYVQMDKVSIAAEVGGRITEVAVRDGQMVDKGQLLFRIDGEPYALTVAQANAAIDAAKVNVGNLSASLAATGVDIKAAKEAVGFAESNFARQAALMEKGFTTKAAYDASKHAVEQARAGLAQARADAAEARAKLATGGSGVNPEVESAKVQRAQAQVNLGRTEVRAPSAGRIAQSDRLQLGQMMVAGLPAVTLVDTLHPYVEANFKETDLADMRVGQRAEIRFDAYPGLKVRGHVESIGAGTGSEFSVLPAQNATGNWVKVTQRVPVRIALDETPSRDMIAGLSADVKVITAK